MSREKLSDDERCIAMNRNFNRCKSPRVFGQQICMAHIRVGCDATKKLEEQKKVVPRGR